MAMLNNQRVFWIFFSGRLGVKWNGECFQSKFLKGRTMTSHWLLVAPYSPTNPFRLVRLILRFIITFPIRFAILGCPPFWDNPKIILHIYIYIYIPLYHMICRLYHHYMIYIYIIFIGWWTNLHQPDPARWPLGAWASRVAKAKKIPSSMWWPAASKQRGHGEGPEEMVICDARHQALWRNGDFYLW